MIELPWPPAELSGHNNGSWYGKATLVKNHRAWAKLATLAADPIAIPDKGDIHISFTFYPPDNRGDRTNFACRLKPQIDGIAEALGINDKRFLPAYHFAAPSAHPKVVVVIDPAIHVIGRAA